MPDNGKFPVVGADHESCINLKKRETLWAQTVREGFPKMSTKLSNPWWLKFTLKASSWNYTRGACTSVTQMWPFNCKMIQPNCYIVICGYSTLFVVCHAPEHLNGPNDVVLCGNYSWIRDGRPNLGEPRQGGNNHGRLFLWKELSFQEHNRVRNQNKSKRMELNK